MKLMRVGAPGAEKPAMLDPAGTSATSPTSSTTSTPPPSPPGLDKLRALDPASLPKIAPGGRIGPCVPRPMNFICIGLNYADHAAESNLPIPKEPIIFLKSLGAYCGPQRRRPPPSRLEEGRLGGRTRHRHRHRRRLHRRGRRPRPRRRLLPLQRRQRARIPDRARRHLGQGQGLPHLRPHRPLARHLRRSRRPARPRHVVRRRRQAHADRHHPTMIFNVPVLVSYVSRFMTLYPGDIISTGTPPGVGMGKKPEPVFLRPGQTMHLGIAGLGEQTQKVVGG